MYQTKHNLFIGGNWRKGSGEPFQKSDPIKGETLWAGACATDKDVADACHAARLAFPAWAKTPLDERLAIIKRFADLVKQNEDTLSQIISSETAKPLWETRTEVGSVVGKVAISIDAYHARTGQQQKDGDDGFSQLIHRPHGVLAVFGAYNFPAHLPNGHIVPALIAGNTVVFKPSELAPKTGEFMVALWQETGLPDGVLNLVQGKKETGQALAGSDAVDGVLFTGSAGVGQLLSCQLASTPQKILALEMGGNNALIIESYGDTEDELKAVVTLALQSAFLSAGQRCTCARRILVKKGDKGDSFVARFVKAASTLLVDDYDAKPAPFMGGVVSLDAKQKLLDAQQKLINLGATPLLSMQCLGADTSLLSAGILEVTGIDVPDEEYFGPLTTIVRYDDFDEAIALANATRFGLSCALVSQNRDDFERLVWQGRAGVINWNKPTTGASSAMPFGGVGISGNHRPSAYYAADYCAHPVASMGKDTLALPNELPYGITL